MAHNPKQPRIAVVVGDMPYPPTTTLAAVLQEKLAYTGYDYAVTRNPSSQQRYDSVPVGKFQALLSAVLKKAETEARKLAGFDYYALIFRVSIHIEKRQLGVPGWMHEGEFFFLWIRDQYTGDEWMMSEAKPNIPALYEKVVVASQAACNKRKGYARTFRVPVPNHVTELSTILYEGIVTSTRAMPIYSNSLM